MLISHAENYKEIVSPRAPVSLMDIENRAHGLCADVPMPA